MADKPSKDAMRRINTSRFMESIDYNWSNDAQCYFHWSYKMPMLTREQAEYWFDHRDKLSGVSFKEE